MNIQTLIQAIGTVVNSLLVITAGVAVLVFFWGLVVFVFKSGDEKSHTEGKNRMIWGIIALVVMVSVWGIIRFVSQDLGLSSPASTSIDNSPNPCGTEADGITPAPCGNPQDNLQ
jgi:heme/copper-type cytochrome/quinol oxidase subunit 2